MNFWSGGGLPLSSNQRQDQEAQGQKEHTVQSLEAEKGGGGLPSHDFNHARCDYFGQHGSIFSGSLRPENINLQPLR